MITCTRRINFDAAHRLMGHEGKCKHMHGHRYVLEATFAAEKLDNLGRVVDFGVIKEKLGGWIDAHWDHNAVLYEKDQALGKAIEHETKQVIFYLPENPTAENMASYIFNVVCPELFTGSGLRCTAVTLHETPNCRASITA